jgi:3-oxoacyl-[acyl-carrier-protein] synthase III
MNEQLLSLAYFSRNAITGSPETVQAEIRNILESARRNNQANGVTGALLFSDGCFAQVLEGRQDDVEAIFETIQCDARHADVTILHLHPVERRSVAQWSMAFAGISGVSRDPELQQEGMGSADDVMATVAGRNLLAALHSVVHRDDVARRELDRRA